MDNEGDAIDVKLTTKTAIVLARLEQQGLFQTFVEWESLKSSVC